MKLYIIRHGETEWNKQMKLQGRSDIPLNEYGRELAKITANALADRQFDIVYSSSSRTPIPAAMVMPFILYGLVEFLIVLRSLIISLPAMPNPNLAPAMDLDFEKVCVTRRLSYFSTKGTQLSQPKST